MPICKQKINASQDKVFNYLSELQNVVDLYKDSVPIITIKDLGSACYGKKYRYEVEKTKGSRYEKQAFEVEITKFEPYRDIAWLVNFDRRTKLSRNTTYIPTIVLLNCTLKPKRGYTLALLEVEFDMKSSWWIKLLFYTIIRLFKNRICKLLIEVRKDIEQKNVH